MKRKQAIERRKERKKERKKGNPQSILNRRGYVKKITKNATKNGPEWIVWSIVIGGLVMRFAHLSIA